MIEELNKDFDRLAPIMLLYEDNPKKDEVTKKIRNFYFGNKSIDDSTKSELTDVRIHINFKHVPWYLI